LEFPQYGPNQRSVGRRSVAGHWSPVGPQYILLLTLISCVTIMTSSDTLCHRQHAQWIAFGHWALSYRLFIGNIPLSGLVSEIFSDTRNTLYCDQSNYSSRIVFSDIPIEFGQKGISAIQSAVLKNPTAEPNMKWIGRPLAEIWPFEISPIWAK